MQLFGSLPPHVQLILGGPRNEKIWNQLKDTSQIPAYLNDITLEFQEDRQLRGYIPNETHLLISDSGVTEPVRTRVMSGLDQQNILPEGNRRRVRFNV